MALRAPILNLGALAVAEYIRVFENTLVQRVIVIMAESDRPV